ncbi:MAG: 8-amino-7-oxononanoate synthase [Rikenellaceae bacterium]|nr:8-amino-7-oxononanoate synthase [Rikenellaceae bacterium]
MNTMDRYEKILYDLKESGNLRYFRDVKHDGSYIEYNGRRMINLSSNDYLGLSSNIELWREFMNRETEKGVFGGGTCSSRLLTGNHQAYRFLECKLAAAYGSEEALVLVSGYHANIGILPAVSGPKDLILADKLVHASIIDGVKLSSAQFLRYRHNDMKSLESMLEKNRKNYDRVFIVTESVFSMDGDLCDLDKLVEIKKKYDACLYVDEAHAVGVISGKGLGLCAEKDVLKEVDFMVGTFGKAYASQGAFVILSGTMKDFLINKMRPLIFSTALPPVSVNWTEFVFDRIAEMNDRRVHLKNISDRLRNGLREAGFETCGESSIIPIILRNNDKCVRFSDYLCSRGFFVLPIRPPTVPVGGERLRISLTAAVTDKNIEDFLSACKRFGT